MTLSEAPPPTAESMEGIFPCLSEAMLDAGCSMLVETKWKSRL
jgi:hypothetical protein